MSTLSHIEALQDKHAQLEKTIEREQLRPDPDEVRIHELKREKLKIKDEINALNGAGSLNGRSAGNGVAYH